METMTEILTKSGMEIYLETKKVITDSSELSVKKFWDDVRPKLEKRGFSALDLGCGKYDRIRAREVRIWAKRGPGGRIVGDYYLVVGRANAGGGKYIINRAYARKLEKAHVRDDVCLED